MPNADIHEEAKKIFNECIKTVKENGNSDLHAYHKLSDKKAQWLAKILRPIFGVDPDKSDAKTNTHKKDSPLSRLAKGEDINVSIDNKNITIDGKEIQALQEKVKIYYKGEEINQHSSPARRTSIRHLYLLKAGKEIPKDEIPNEYQKSFCKYKAHLEKENYYLVTRFESKTFFSNDNKTIKHRPTIRYDGYFPKLTYSQHDNGYQSHAFRNFTDCFKLYKNGSLKNQHKLKELYKEIFRSHLKVSSQNKEIYSTVVPGAFLTSLKINDQLAAKKCYVNALVEVVNEIKKDINKKKHLSKYSGFRGIFINCGGEQELNDIANKNNDLLIFNNGYNASILDELSSGKIITAQPIMSEAFSTIGNGALGDKALSAKDERDMRHSLGINSAVADPYYNSKLANDIGFLFYNTRRDHHSTCYDLIQKSSQCNLWEYIPSLKVDTIPKSSDNNRAWEYAISIDIKIA